MYAFIRGKLMQGTPIFAIVDVSGVGYKIFIPPSLFAKLPQTGEDVILHTSFVVRELSQALYGFQSPQERDLFEALMAVTGIGPKTALSLIGHLSIQDMHQAIAQGDTVTLSKVPGIGKKTAERLIIEMRDKIGNLLPGDPSDHAVHSISDPRAQKISDAMGALINLGYNQVTAQKAIKKSMQDLPEGIDLADLIMHSLKHV